MQIVGMSAGLLVVGLLLGACAHEISNEDRLDRETRSVSKKEAAVTASELAKVSCDDTPHRLAKARSDNRPESDRLLAYVELYQSLRQRVSTFDAAMARNPDLAYREGNQDLVAAREGCVQQAADVKVEFERYVRDLVAIPTALDVKGGNNVTVARVDFQMLRQAIEVLGPDDKDQLLARVSAVERKLELKPVVEQKRRGR